MKKHQITISGEDICLECNHKRIEHGETGCNHERWGRGYRCKCRKFKQQGKK